MKILMLIVLGVVSSLAQPNIMFILLDDARKDDILFMPNVQSLMVDSGFTFENTFAANPFCCPDRAAILTGMLPHNNGVLTNMLPDGGYQKYIELGLDTVSIGIRLQAMGYRTGMFGKFLNQYEVDDPYIPAGWTRWWGMDGRYRDYRVNDDGVVVNYGDTEAEYETLVMLEKVTDFMTTGPWFAYVCPSAPHQKCVPETKYEHTFDGVTAPRPPSYNEADVSDKPAWVQDLPLLNARTQAQIDTIYQKRLAVLQSVDDMIGSLVDTLRARGQLDSTWIILTSDNGFELGEHRWTGKQDPYAGSVELPLVIRGPGVPIGSSRELISMVDLFPTIIELGGTKCQVKLREAIRGRATYENIR